MKLSKSIAVLFVLGTLSFSQILKADGVVLPKITAPAALQEGTERVLTAQQIEELLPWAKNTKSELLNLLENVQGLSSQDKLEKLVEGIKSVVPSSAPKNSELFMRYALNRGLVVYESLSKELDADAVGTIDAKIRILTASINMALNYYDNDLKLMDKKKSATFASFGIEYFEFLYELNKSIFDASAQYVIQRTALEWLQWDLYRDLNNQAFASQIIKINSGLKTFQAAKVKDSQAITFIRRMKQISSELKLRETLEQINQQERARIASLKKESAAESAAELARKDEQEIIDAVASLSGKKATNAKISKNDLVYYLGDSKQIFLGRIAAIQENGNFVIRFSADSLLSNINRKDITPLGGCNEANICVNDTLIYTAEPTNKVIVKGIQTDGKLAVQFLGPKYNGSGRDYDLSKLSLTKGSINGLSVGDEIINTYNNFEATIVGIQSDEKYIIQYTSGNYKGNVSAGWKKEYIVKK